MSVVEAGAQVKRASEAAGWVHTGGTWEKTKHRTKFLCSAT